MPHSKREPLVLLGIAAAALLLSSVSPYDRATWLLEVFPVLIAAPILVATYGRFPLTPLLYRLLLLHALILIVGGHYTYARVPVGYWVQNLFDLSRNHYDRLGHLAQGFVPAILAREILLRRSPLLRGKWLFFLVVCVCLAFSAFYELIEWWAALSAATRRSPSSAPRATSGTRSGTCFSLLSAAPRRSCSFSRKHDREIARLEATPKRSPGAAFYEGDAVKPLPSDDAGDC